MGCVCVSSYDKRPERWLEGHVCDLVLRQFMNGELSYLVEPRLVTNRDNDR
jgi:hypothetical protein